MSAFAPRPRQQALLNRAAARALLETLAQGGLGALVLSPGSRSTPIALAAAALEAQGLLQLHVVLDERAAAFFALGLCQRSRRPVALACTSGSAPGHYLPASALAGKGTIGWSSKYRPQGCRSVGCLDRRCAFPRGF